MSIMCEQCKCTLEPQGGCENGCTCCNGQPVEEGAALRAAQVLAVTEEERDQGNEDNPVLFAEYGPNRFRVMSWFFPSPEEDGVNVTEDLDTGDVTVKYFNDRGETEITEGALYEWALNLYEND